jgi:uncharacterized membrane protein (DUF373 family)
MSEAADRAKSTVDSNRLWNLFDAGVLLILRAILAVGIIAAIVDVSLLVIHTVPHSLTAASLGELQNSVQALFAGVLLVILGLELLETLRHYFVQHHLRAEFLLSVALIAVARHVVRVDYEHASPGIIAAMAFLLFTLGAAYIGMRRLIRARSPDEKEGGPA